tara:strand:- start:655 stop:1068 length:414 start_codon:yes stop_codon:yes gene_type:complete
MPNYVKDGDRIIEDAFGGTGYGQKPGPKPDNAFDRAHQVLHCTMSKTPQYVIVTNGDGADDTIGFFFGSSASFASKSTTEGGVSIGRNALTGSAHYVSFGNGLASGTKLNISPMAWSGSAAMSVVFYYNGGLDGGGI